MSKRETKGRRVLRQIPNAISIARLAGAPVLIALAYLELREPFKWLLFAAFASDIVDGYIARRFDSTTKSGPFLDSVADLCTLGAAGYGVYQFYPELVTDHPFAFTAVIGLWMVNKLLALWRYGRLPSFHTYLLRAAAYIFAFFLAALFFIGPNVWLFYFTIGMMFLGLTEEFFLLCRFSHWRADVKGLYWILRGDFRADP